MQTLPDKTFVSRVEATHLGLLDARASKVRAAALCAKVAVKIGDTVYEAQEGEVLHAQIAIRARREGATGLPVDGWTFPRRETVPALTIHQPWASAIIAGVKPVENRVWSPSLQPGDRLLIHAGASTASLEVDSIMGPVRTLWPECPTDFPLGSIIGFATFCGVVREHHRPDCPWSGGPICWLLRDPVALDPIRYRGARGLFRVPLGVLPARYHDALG